MMEVKRILLSILLVALPFTFLGCGPMDQASAKHVDIRGEIVELQRMEIPTGEETETIGAILIQGSVEADTRYDAAWITIVQATEIVVQRGRNRQPVSFEDITIGQLAEVRFSGQVKETYPLQGTAAEVVILD